MRFLVFAFVAALALVGPCLSDAHAAPLNFCFEDAPQAPWTMPDGTGLNFDMLRRVEKLTGEQFVFVARPWKRCQEEARNGLMDGMIGAADSPERRVYSLPPLLPDGSPDANRAMYQDRVDIYLRAGSGASWDGTTLVNPRGIVVAQTGYFVADLMRARGQNVKDTIKSAEEGLRLLAAGTADVAVLQGRAAEDLVRNDPRFRGRIVLAKAPFTVFPFYLLISRKTHAADPRRIEAIWNAIGSVRTNPDYRKLEAATTRGSEAD
jgi:polar amino acid transport system substrate-binding protein